jgi:hypothetical protein
MDKALDAPEMVAQDRICCLFRFQEREDDVDDYRR